jgi:cytoskeletal protein CcmA (bactofilin family)
VEGKVTGDLEGTEKVVITKTGHVEGNIVAPAVTLEDGAKFKGSIDMDPGPAHAQASAPKPVKSVPDAQADTADKPSEAADKPSVGAVRNS